MILNNKEEEKIRLYLNPDLPVEERIDHLISALTDEEKIQLLNNSGQEITRLGIKTAGQVEGYHGAALGGPAGWGGEKVTPTTQFCQAIGLGATWDPELIQKAAEAEAIEFRFAYHCLGQGGLVVRAPNADLGRDPRWGRTEECYGEDPYFNGTMTTAFVKGLQGDDPYYLRTASLLKHFLANSNEDTRCHSNSDFDDRLFWEYYSVPFRMGFQEGGAVCYMTAYNAYKNIPCIINPFIKEITVKEWGVNGIICTDGGALGLLVTEHHYFPDNIQASAACIKAGISQFLDDLFKEGIPQAIEKKLITIADIESAVRPNLRIMFRLGLFDPPERVPYTAAGTIPPWETEKHKALAKEVTRKSIVLLKNQNKQLPLDKNKIKKIAVIGRWAEEVFLDWYSGTPPYKITPLEGIRRYCREEVTVEYSSGSDQNRAVQMAENADIAIVFLGNDPICGNIGWATSQYPSEGKEGVDRKIITLEPQDQMLIKQVYNANQNTIAVIISSFPYAIDWIQENIPAIIWLTHNSQETGHALADVLFGDYNPAGRLVQTWPGENHILPDIMDYNIRHGRTYMYFKDKPLYPFGFGLSYTDFSYSNLQTDRENIQKDETLKISVDVANTGNRDGEEVIQLYLRYVESKIERPQKELRGFRRIMIKSCETQTVELNLKYKNLAYWEINRHCWRVESGEIQLLIGCSSSDQDIKLSKIIQVKGSFFM